MNNSLYSKVEIKINMGKPYQKIDPYQINSEQLINFKVESNINMKKRTKKIPINIFNHLFYNSYLFLLYQIFQIFDNLYLFRKKKIVKRKYTIKIGF